MVDTTSDWRGPQRRFSGVLSLVLATALSFAAGVGSTLVYLQNDRRESVVVVPLVEADKAPTRVRPEGLDDNGNAVARAANNFGPTSSAFAMAPPEEALTLPVQGIPSVPEIEPPVNARVIAEIKPVRTEPENTEEPALNSGPEFRLQLATFRTATAANTELARLNPMERMSGPLSVERIDTGARGIFYRVMSQQPVAERDAAKEMCASFAQRRVPCLVVSTNVSAVGGPLIPVAHVAPAPPATAPVAVEEPKPAPTLATVPTIAENRTAAAAIRAQLGSMRSMEGATRELNRLSRLYPEALGQTGLTVSRIDQGGRGVYYRILTGPLPNRAAAGELCQQLEANQAGCVLIPRSRDNLS